MNLKKQIAVVGALTMSALALTGTAAGQDAHERSAGVSGQAAIAYFDAHERATLAKSSGLNAIEYFRANERATIGQSGSTGAISRYVDAAQRSEPPRWTRETGQAVVVDGSGFDWGSAAVGASSALFLAFLIGVTLMTVRRLRAGQLAH